MKLRSFRLRIALLSTILAGTALVGFSSIAWKLIYVAKLSRLDDNLINQVRRLARPLPLDVWPAAAADLSRELGIDATTVTALQILNSEGELVYQSESWSTEFNRSDLFPPNPIVLPSPPANQVQPEPPAKNPPRRHNSAEHRFPLLDITPRIVTQRTATDSWRIASAHFSTNQVAIAVNLQSLDQEMAAIRNIFLVVIPGTLLLVAGGAWALSGSALQPIRRLTAMMQQITVTGLDQRVPIGTTDIEFVELIQVFNQMLERLERSFKQASRFSADAAHELKTPLAILQGELEQALQQAEPGSELQQSLSSLLDEVRRLSGIIRKLLLLSLADAGQMSLHKIEVNVSEMLAVMIEDLELLAPHLKLQTEITSELWVWGDRDLLTQVLQNLMSNAIKYNLPEGWIQIQAKRQSRTVQVTVMNASRTIPESDRHRIFDRFYRGDPARTRKVEGIGLGLSLSREIVRAHGGSLTLDETQDDRTAFTLILPARLPLNSKGT